MDQVDEAQNLGNAVVDLNTEQGLNEMRMCADCLGCGSVGGKQCIYCKGAGRLLTYRARMLREQRAERIAAAAQDLYAAAKFARSVLAANPVEMSERMAIEKLDAAIALADKGPASQTDSE